MALKDWKRIRGTANSPAWKKGDTIIEVFQDSSWKNDNANVIFYDHSKKSYESALGKDYDVKYFDTKKEALAFAKNYMRNN